MSAIPKLDRVLLSQSRDREYFDVNELRTMTGQPAPRFPDVVLKELCDNALDAAEQAGVAPTLVIQLWRRRRNLVLRIKDNGAGITPEAVEGVLDFKARSSDKAAYRSITRGLQGNALKTVLGIPYALGSRQPLVVEARGKKWVVRPHIDPAGIAHLDPAARDVADRGGTRWTLSLPLRACANLSLLRWARGFSLFNPHATVKLREVRAASELAQDDAQKERNYSPPAAAGEKIGTSGAPSELAQGRAQEVTNIFPPVVEFPGGWKKFLPTDLIPIHWYDAASLKRLVFGLIAKARRGGPDWTLAQFVEQFPGFKDKKRRRAICEQFLDIDRLTDFENREDRVADLLDAMQNTPGLKRPKPESLGCVGKEPLSPSVR